MAFPTFIEFFLPNWSGYTLIGTVFFALGLAVIIFSKMLIIRVPILTPFLTKIASALMVIGLFLAFALSWIVNIFQSIELTLIIFGTAFLIGLSWFLFSKPKRK